MDAEKDYPYIGDNFEVLELIGKGGMGSVYKVRDLSLDKIVAIKVLQAEFTEDKAALKRFEQEAEAAANLSHPNLISIYGHGSTASGAPYILMDYCEGRSLSSVLKEEGVIKSKRALKILRQICDALDHAHKNDVIHRDIKPNNIILSSTQTHGL